MSLVLSYCNLRDNELNRYEDENHAGGHDTVTSIQDVSYFIFDFSNKILYLGIIPLEIIFRNLKIVSSRSTSLDWGTTRSSSTSTITPLSAQMTTWMITSPTPNDPTYFVRITSPFWCGTFVVSDQATDLRPSNFPTSRFFQNFPTSRFFQLHFPSWENRLRDCFSSLLFDLFGYSHNPSRSNSLSFSCLIYQYCPIFPPFSNF